MSKAPRGTIAIEEAVLNPDGISWMAESATLFNPGQDASKLANHGHTQALLDVHGTRLERMNATGVEYMLLSLTSPGAQGEPDREKAKKLAFDANDWLAAEVAKNPARFGGFASISMHNAEDAVVEARRAVKELGMYGIMLNDYQVVNEGGDNEGKKYYDAAEYLPFWEAVQELDVPVYMHPRYPQTKDLQPRTRYGDRKQILGAAVQFHLDLSMHLYALCSSGIFDLYPRLQVVAGHLGEG